MGHTQRLWLADHRIHNMKGMAVMAGAPIASSSSQVLSTSTLCVWGVYRDNSFLVFLCRLKTVVLVAGALAVAVAVAVAG